MTFIGPTTIALMGDKVSARRLMIASDVPVVPGSEGALASLSDLKNRSKKVVIPIMLKAAVGGGGRGMRIVREDADLEATMRVDAKLSCVLVTIKFFASVTSMSLDILKSRFYAISMVEGFTYSSGTAVCSASAKAFRRGAE